MLMLFRSPKQLQSSDVFSNAQLQDTLKQVTVVQRSSILICGNQPAQYLEARGSSARGEEDRVDMVMTNAAGSTYFAMYVRPITSITNPAAEAALRELCTKP